MLVLPLLLGVTSAGGRTFAVSPVTVQVIGKGTVTSSPAGVDCGNGAATCYLAFSGSATVTLTAVPAADWAFDAWTNCPTAPVGNTCKVPVDGNPYEVKANFAGPPSTSSTLSLTYAGSGSVTGGGIDCGSSPAGSACTLSVLTGSTLTVRETPAPGNVFAGWGGACTGSNVACTVHLAGDRSVGAAWVSSEAVLLTVAVSGNGTVTGGGISCPTTCVASHATNSTVVLTATAAPGHVFTGWDGACSGTAPTCSVLMSEAKSVTAGFAQVVQLSVSVSGDGAGSVRDTEGAINCGNNGTVCAANVPLDETITLTVTPATGSTFTGWSGACGGTTTTCTILMTGSKSVTATFAAEARLSVTVAGSGNVSGEAGAINCGSGADLCSAGFPVNKIVTVAATAGAGATFTGWSGACGGTSASCTVLMTASKSVTATFSGGAGATAPLTVAVNGPGTVTGAGISCGGGSTVCTATPAVNSNVTLTASPAAGATFAGWGGACSGTSPSCTLSMTSARSVSATFTGAAPTNVPLTVNVSGPGRVAGAGINCGNGATTCRVEVTANATVTLTATRASGATFVGWGGSCSGRTTSCAIRMDVARQVSAQFRGAERRTLTIRVRGRGTVRSAAGRCIGHGPRKTCVQRFAVGRRVVLTAGAARGMSFSGWSGACRGKKKTCTVKLNVSRTVTATFVRRRTAPASRT